MRTGETGWLFGGVLLLASSLVADTVFAKEPPLPGKTYDYVYDGRDVGHPERAYEGRAYLPPAAARQKGALPLLVFLHGLNSALIEHRWMGGGSEGDVRRIVGELVDAGTIAPLVIAGPGSVVASEVSKGASWNHFDVDNFVDRTVAALQGVAEIDPTRILVAGHSGAGCSDLGGLARVGKSRRRLLAVLSIDTCMAPSLAERFAALSPETHVVVSYQTLSWGSRPFDLFRKAFEREMAKVEMPDGVLRVLDHQKPTAAPHDATVALTFERWLPKIVPPAP
jgi:hypothetical protein